MITVGIIEDDVEIRKALQTFLNLQKGFVCSIGYDSVEKFLNFIRKNDPPQVLVLDIGLPGMSGIDGMKILKAQHPSMDIIVFSIYNDAQKIFDSLCSGATGYLLKNTPLQEVKEGIELLAKGGSPMSPQIARRVIEFFGEKRINAKSGSALSEREKEIVVGLVDGLTYKLIAVRMNITIETVRFHIKNIYKKLHVHCRSEVITKSLRGEI